MLAYYTEHVWGRACSQSRLTLTSNPPSPAKHGTVGTPPASRRKPAGAHRDFDAPVSVHQDVGALQVLRAPVSSIPA